LNREGVCLTILVFFIVHRQRQRNGTHLIKAFITALSELLHNSLTLTELQVYILVLLLIDSDSRSGLLHYQQQQLSNLLRTLCVFSALFYETAELFALLKWRTSS
jgi:hypothetical protein